MQLYYWFYLHEITGNIYLKWVNNRSSHRRCSLKKLFLKIRYIHRKAPVLGSIFKNVAGLKACDFNKKWLKHRLFPVNKAKFLRISIVMNICDHCFCNSFILEFELGFLKMIGFAYQRISAPFKAKSVIKEFALSRT